MTNIVLILAGIQGILSTSDGSRCAWKEHSYGGGKKKRSLRLICDCPKDKKLQFKCEYKGNPHILKGGYNSNSKKAINFYKEVAKFVSGMSQ